MKPGHRELSAAEQLKLTDVNSVEFGSEEVPSLASVGRSNSCIGEHHAPADRAAADRPAIRKSASSTASRKPFAGGGTPTATVVGGAPCRAGSDERDMGDGRPVASVGAGTFVPPGAACRTSIFYSIPEDMVPICTTSATAGVDRNVAGIGLVRGLPGARKGDTGSAYAASPSGKRSRLQSVDAAILAEELPDQ